MNLPFYQCLGLVAPFYNLTLVVIVIILFIKLFRTPNKRIYIKPWKMLFYAVLVYVVEEVLTALSHLNIIIFPRIFNAIFEMVIVTLFIYMLLLQKESIRKLK